ncbi:MAG: hypothetical protein SNG38_07945 [Rikenellaceae bacterium]
MKKHLLILGAVILFMASCAKDDLRSALEGNVVVQLQIQTDESLSTRASEVQRYAVEAYLDSDYSIPALVFENSTASSLGGF